MAPSNDLLHRLSRINPLHAFLAALVIMLAGLFLPGIVGAAVLGLLVAGLITLTYLTWPVQPAATRAVRIVIVTALLGVVIFKVIG